jgi:hypothetical protein
MDISAGISYRSVHVTVNIDGREYRNRSTEYFAEPVSRVSRIALEEHPNGEREEL